MQIPPTQARILCSDYRDIPKGTKYDKIVSLEMAEVGSITVSVNLIGGD